MQTGPNTNHLSFAAQQALLAYWLHGVAPTGRAAVEILAVTLRPPSMPAVANTDEDLPRRVVIERVRPVIIRGEQTPFGFIPLAGGVDRTIGFGIERQSTIVDGAGIPLPSFIIDQAFAGQDCLVGERISPPRLCPDLAAVIHQLDTEAGVAS